MADLNKAFNTLYSGRTYDTKQVVNDLDFNDINYSGKKIVGNQDLMNNQNVVSNFMPYHTAFERIKVSNSRYDNLTRYTDKPTYGYECLDCGKPIGYHLSLPNCHEFIKGKFRPLLEEETGAYVNGRPLQ